MSRIATLHMLRSAISDSLRSRGFIISWLNHTLTPCSGLPDGDVRIYEESWRLGGLSQDRAINVGKRKGRPGSSSPDSEAQGPGHPQCHSRASHRSGQGWLGRIRKGLVEDFMALLGGTGDTLVVTAARSVQSASGHYAAVRRLQCPARKASYRSSVEPRMDFHKDHLARPFGASVIKSGRLEMTLAIRRASSKVNPPDCSLVSWSLVTT